MNSDQILNEIDQKIETEKSALKVLQLEAQKIHQKITKQNNIVQQLREKRDQTLIDSLTEIDWDLVFHADFVTTKALYKYQCRIFEEFGLRHMGFNTQTNQHCMVINFETGDQAEFDENLGKAELIFKHLKAEDNGRKRIQLESSANNSICSKYPTYLMYDVNKAQYIVDELVAGFQNNPEYFDNLKDALQCGFKRICEIEES